MLSSSADQDLVIAVAEAWDRIVQRLDGAVSAIKGISFSEYRLLRRVADSPSGRASRVDLADAVGLTPSGVTRALRPLEKLGYVETTKSDRDARLALASLTTAGLELVTDASGVIDDAAAQLIAPVRPTATRREGLVALLQELAAG